MNLRYGLKRWGRYIFGGPTPNPTGGGDTISYPLQPGGYSVRVYNTAGQKVAEYSSDVKNNIVLSAKFELQSSGCGSFSLVLATMPDEISYNTRIDISLLGDQSPWYSGYVTVMPKKGTTKRTFEYQGSGFYDQLDRVIINRTFAETEISQIVKDIMTLYVEPRTDIVYRSSLIYTTDYQAAKLKFGYVTAAEAISDLAEYAANYVFGVNEQRRLFFKPVNTKTLLWLHVGYHVQSFEPVESIDDLVNHIYVKASGSYVTTLAAAINASTVTVPVVSVTRISVDDVIKIDDEDMLVTAITSKNLTVVRARNSTDAAAHTAGVLVDNTSLSTSTIRIIYECQDDDSILQYGQHDDILSIPSAVSEDAGQRWGDYQLSKKKNPTVTATLKNVAFSSLIRAEGLAHITSEDGLTTYTLPIVKVNYEIKSTGLQCGMTLGKLPADNLDRYLAGMFRDIRSAELLSQYASEDE